MPSDNRVQPYQIWTYAKCITALESVSHQCPANEAT